MFLWRGQARVRNPDVGSDGVPAWATLVGSPPQSWFYPATKSLSCPACRRRRMTVHGERALRQRVCLGSDCHAVFWICPHCDRGQRYCSLTCRSAARQRQRRCANRRHQQSPEGRLDHRDRQQEYRRRRRQQRVTDQSSPAITFSASSECGALDATAVNAPVSGCRFWPLWPEQRPGVWLRCRACGRISRFVDPFPHIPRRR